MAAGAGNCATTLRVAAMLILIVTLTFPPSISVNGGSPPLLSSSSSRDGGEEIIRRKGVLGSRPPGCMNKCMNCRPCEATLVIPPHQSYSHRDDDTYYLLSWKCRCGNRLFQP